MKKSSTILACLFVSLSVLSFTSQGKPPKGLSIFVKQEINTTDRITGVGVAQRIEFAYSDFGAETTTNINHAEVLTEDGYLEEFLAWEVGVKVGYFSDVFFYVEAGIDLAEGILNADRNDDCCYTNYEQNNDPDGYAGLGLGFQLQHARLELSARARQLDSDNWRSQAYIFYGAQLSIGF
ncbi:hypothetical protein [Paraglaciecola sp.]|uniref:hypothetical protein n=1 Tax=Paraglaciecola sp. TaxID=1920173 RepID=UPI00273FE4C7|nr:hypothetical protein [Paraglaciecola sp.]MDP5029573.1 hypothetical protein [Paraglaciecola sp.]